MKMTSYPGNLIFLMEDEEDIARLIAHHLEANGFRVHRPERSSTLISEAEVYPPAVFILDLMLPEVDGFELCGSIKASKILKDVPVLILTARTGMTDRKRAEEAGADSYMTKPFKFGQLIATVRALCEGNPSRAL
jgi:DNA-binding response OmpR family regulator